jgi:multidrug resistance efflux pump
MKSNWYFILVLLLFVAMMFVTVKFFRGSGHSSIGITNASTYRINADKSAVVKNIPVVPGQQVKAGELLVELTSNELEMEVERVMQRIAVLKSDQSERSKLADSKIALIRAESGIKVEELNTDIAESEGDLSLNREIVKAQNLEMDSLTIQPVARKIRSLKKQRDKEQEAAAIRIQDILHSNTIEQRLLDNQIKIVQRELDLLAEEKKKLSKFAASDGVVESVLVMQGEQVSAFTPLVSVNPIHPRTVVGYLVGKKEALPVGSSVKVRSYDRPGTETSGKVIGYGSVVELPLILQKSTAVTAFGREVFIEITSDNQFAAGEKVFIR